MIPVADSYSVPSGGVILAGRYPSWVPAVGTIADVSTNNLEDVRGADDLNQTRAIMSAWSGAAYVEGWGRYGSMIFTGGGHGDGKLNAIYRYDIETRAFTKIKNSAPWFLNASNRVADNVTGWMWADASGTTMQVGEPFAAHFYSGLVGVPASAMPGATNGWLITAGRNTMPQGADQETNQPHKIALGDDQTWAFCGGALTRPAGYGGACYDSLRNRVASFSGNTVTTFGYIDLDDETVGDINYTKTVGYPELQNYYRAAFYDAASDLYITADVRATYPVSLIHPTTGLITTPAIVGDAPAGSGGWDWVEEWGALVFYPGSGNTVWTLKRPVNPLTGTWEWASQTLTGTPRAQAAGNPHYTRFRYSKRLNSFLWASACNAPVQAFRINRP